MWLPLYLIVLYDFMCHLLCQFSFNHCISLYCMTSCVICFVNFHLRLVLAQITKPVVPDIALQCKQLWIWSRWAGTCNGHGSGGGFCYWLLQSCHPGGVLSGNLHMQHLCKLDPDPLSESPVHLCTAFSIHTHNSWLADHMVYYSKFVHKSALCTSPVVCCTVRDFSYLFLNSNMAYSTCFTHHSFTPTCHISRFLKGLPIRTASIVLSVKIDTEVLVFLIIFFFCGCGMSGATKSLFAVKIAFWFSFCVFGMYCGLTYGVAEDPG